MKNFLKIFILAAFIFTFVPFSYGAPSQQQVVNKKLKNVNQKIKDIKVLEGLEKNRLHRNQQQLETTARNLAKSQNTYNILKSELSDAEKDYDVAMQEYNIAVTDFNNKIRFIYKGYASTIILCQGFNLFSGYYLL